MSAIHVDHIPDGWHAYQRERGMEVPLSLFERLADEASEAKAFVLEAHLRNLAEGFTRPGWNFTCLLCGAGTEANREKCPGKRS